MELIRVDDPDEAGTIAAGIIASRALAGPARIALPGGRSVVPVYDSLAAYPKSVLSNLDVRIADERIFGDKNEDVIRTHLIEAAERNGVTIEFKAPQREGSRDEIVRSYEKTVPDAFDIVLVGVGEDGHVLGLYPGFPQLDSDDRVEAFEDSPKQPPERMTTTLRCYDPQRTLAILLFLGEGKSEALARFLEKPDHHELPAAYFHRFSVAFAITDQHA